MHRHAIKDEDWSRIEHLLPGQPGGHGGVALNNRLFMDALLHIAKTGVPWRDLPERFGKWDTVYQRFRRWCRTGVLQRIFEVLQDPDLEWFMMDSTTSRAHPHAAGMNSEADDQALGRSRGGFGTKIHIGVDALGNPVTIHLSPAQDADISHAEELLGDLEPEKVIADKGYDSDAFAAKVQERGSEVVIPPKKNRLQPRDYDRTVYQERNKVERCIGYFKQYRRVATRYEKTARSFLGMVLLAAIMIWLR
jgi:transposase